MTELDMYTCIGVAEGRARDGVAIIVSERWAEWLRSWKCRARDVCSSN